MNPKNGEAVSWSEEQKRFYKAFPHAHLEFTPDSLYAQNIVSVVLARTGLRPDKNILEVGCGLGRFTLHLVQNGLRITALDFSEELLEKLEQVARHLGLEANQLRVQAGDISTSTALFNGEEFDSIIGILFLHHLEDLRSGLKSLHRILKSGGDVIFVELNRLNLLFLAQIFLCQDMTWRGEKGTFRYGVSGYHQGFRDSGYTEVEIGKFGFFPPQIVDKFPLVLPIEKRLEKVPFVKPFLPFLFIRAKKPLEVCE